MLDTIKVHTGTHVLIFISRTILQHSSTSFELRVSLKHCRHIDYFYEAVSRESTVSFI